jgi:hypothetical protein
MTPALLRKAPLADDAPDLATVLRELRELRVRVDALEAVRRRPLSAADRNWLTRLLPAVDVATNGAVWALPDLAALSLLPRNGALASALAARTGRTGLQPLGKALARCARHAVDGLELRRVGACRDGVLWQVAMTVAETRAGNAAPGAPDYA